MIFPANLDTLVTKKVRSWLEAPISSCISEWLATPVKKGGMRIPSLKSNFECMRLGKRAALKHSVNENMRELWLETGRNSINSTPDSLLHDRSFPVAKKALTRSQEAAAQEHLLNLGYQGLSSKIVVDNIPMTHIIDWNNCLNMLPGFLYNFVRKGMQQQLPTLSNLLRWGRVPSNICPLCAKPQTNEHVLSNCSNEIVLKRYTSRHDKILNILVQWFKYKIKGNIELFVDLNKVGFKQVSDLFLDRRPDIAFVKGNVVHVLELTVCHETNLLASKQYKINKYKNLSNCKTNLIKSHDIKVSTCEVSVLGFMAIDQKILDFLAIGNLDNTLRNSITRSVIQDSFDLYLHRNG